MKATIEVELQPFQVPNFALEISKPAAGQGGLREVQSYPLSHLDSLTLDRMCGEFRNEVFKKAGKNQPPRAD